MESVYSYSWGEHVLHKAATEGDSQSLQQLLKEGHSPNARGGGPMCWLRGASEIHSRRTPLHYAAKNGHLLCIRLLLKYGADPNSQDSDGYTPLHYLSQIHQPGPDHHGNLKLCVASLVQCGANVRLRNSGGQSALDIALIHKNIVCQKVLKQQCILVPSLLVLSRSAVSALIHSGSLPAPESLNIPSSLIEYLMFEEIFYAWRL